MARLIDADEVVAMLRQEAKEWAAMATDEHEGATCASRIQAAGISLGYKSAAKDVEKMVKKQAAGNVPADKDGRDLY